VAAKTAKNHSKTNGCFVPTPAASPLAAEEAEA
jgi:hypothetical protein